MIIDNKIKIDTAELRDFLIDILWETIPKILEVHKGEKEELLTVNEVSAICKKTRQTIYRWMINDKYKGLFPRPKRIASTNYWLKSEILTFQKTQER